MTWHFYIFVGLAAFVVFVVPRFFKDREYTKTPDDFKIKMFGGPLDKTTQTIQYEKNGEPPHFFIAPYPPALDEEGIPPEENILGIMHTRRGTDTMYIRPNYAYYQQITGEEYFYVRDLDEEELVRLREGKLPEVQPNGDE